MTTSTDMLNFNYHRRGGQQASQEACKYIRQMDFKDFDKWNIVKNEFKLMK